MNYEAFKEALVKETGRQAGESYQVSLQKITKNNGISRDAVSICRKDRKVAPVIYLESFYEQYRKGSSVVRLAADMLEHYREMDSTFLEMDTDFFSDYENARRHIYCKLVNIGMNREMLKEIPYRPYLDLAVVYYYMTDAAGERDATILISRKHLEMWNLSSEELDRQAWDNTLADLTPSLRPMSDILKEYADVQVGEETDSCFLPMYVLTNTKKTFGSICIRYPGVLEQAAEKLGGDFYILPSSVHECILVPAGRTVSSEILKEMVTDINHTQVEPQEVLANQVYLYSRLLNKIVF